MVTYPRPWSIKLHVLSLDHKIGTEFISVVSNLYRFCSGHNEGKQFRSTFRGKYVNYRGHSAHRGEIQLNVGFKLTSRLENWLIPKLTCH
jgi:hypothetical protein